MHVKCQLTIPFAQMCKSLSMRKHLPLKIKTKHVLVHSSICVIKYFPIIDGFLAFKTEIVIFLKRQTLLSSKIILNEHFHWFRITLRFLIIPAILSKPKTSGKSMKSLERAIKRIQRMISFRMHGFMRQSTCKKKSRLAPLWAALFMKTLHYLSDVLSAGSFSRWGAFSDARNDRSRQLLAI